MTNLIAFPCFIGITRKLGMKARFLIKEQHRISISNHVVRLALCLLPSVIMFGILIMLDISGVINAGSMYSWNQEFIIFEKTGIEKREQIKNL